MAVTRKHVAVVGAGVIGVSTAWVLARAGYRVTLVDRSSEAGRGASAGNAAQLSFAYGDAMASPALLRHLPSILLRRDPAFRVEPVMDPAFLLWGMSFLANSSAVKWTQNTRAVLEIARESRDLIMPMIEETGIEFSYRAAGKLHLFADEVSFLTARRGSSLKSEYGFEQTSLSAVEATALEPALALYRGPLAGAVHTPNDAVGDAASYCRKMTAYLQATHGMETAFGRSVKSIDSAKGQFRALRFGDHPPLEADLAVVSTGADAYQLSNTSGFGRLVWPVRGYSLTIDANEYAPMVSLTDVRRKLAFARIGDRLRVAGFADIAPRSATFDPDRFACLVRLANEALPKAVPATIGSGLAWSGERPSTPSSVPLIGQSRSLRGLYVNIGHGMLGWTLALGSAGRILRVVQAV